jgi:hypothetical protein
MQLTFGYRRLRTWAVVVSVSAMLAGCVANPMRDAVDFSDDQESKIFLQAVLLGTIAGVAVCEIIERNNPGLLNGSVSLPAGVSLPGVGAMRLSAKNLCQLAGTTAGAAIAAKQIENLRDVRLDTANLQRYLAESQRYTREQEDHLKHLQDTDRELRQRGAQASARRAELRALAAERQREINARLAQRNEYKAVVVPEQAAKVEDEIRKLEKTRDGLAAFAESPA